MSQIKSDLVSAMKSALKNKLKDRLMVIRFSLAAIKQFEIDHRDQDLTDAVVLDILSKLAKQRKDSISQFKKANREDLVRVEQSQLEIIQEFLPKALSETELRDLVQVAIQAASATQAKDIGKIMKYLKSSEHAVDQNRIDFSIVPGIIREIFGQ